MTLGIVTLPDFIDSDFLSRPEALLGAEGSAKHTVLASTVSPAALTAG
jgi:hypothetical protein